MAGAFAAAMTTPLDVAKTRIMLSRNNTPTLTTAHYSGTLSTLGRIASQEGVRALFSGVMPRTLWIGLGGAVFLGVYEKTSMILRTLGGLDDLTQHDPPK